MSTKRYMPTYYEIINKLWKTAKPYVERLDERKNFDDNTLDEMTASVENFARTHFHELIKGDDVLERKINAVCFELLNAISVNAQREGLLPKMPDDELDNVSMFDEM
ncbi:MAG: hypothetical protein ACI39G_04830 [Pseudoramibacter sp.]